MVMSNMDIGGRGRDIAAFLEESKGRTLSSSGHIERYPGIRLFKFYFCGIDNSSSNMMLPRGITL
jgi:hypothetical protein